MQKGRILAIDYGTKRLGLAITDPDRTIVFPREVLLNTSREQVLRDLKQYCTANRVSLVLVGLPFHENHTENPLTPVVRKFIEELRNTLGIDVLGQDEKFTSAEAKMILEELGMTPAQQKQHRDVLSAMIILQEYLNKML